MTACDFAFCPHPAIRTCTEGNCTNEFCSAHGEVLSDKTARCWYCDGLRTLYTHETLVVQKGRGREAEEINNVATNALPTGALVTTTTTETLENVRDGKGEIGKCGGIPEVHDRVMDLLSACDVAGVKGFCVLVDDRMELKVIGHAHSDVSGFFRTLACAMDEGEVEVEFNVSLRKELMA